MRGAPTRAAAVSLLVSSLGFLSPIHNIAAAKALDPPQVSTSHYSWLGPNALGTFVRKFIDGRTVCVEASVQQARSIRDRDPGIPLTSLVPDSEPSASQQPGARIVLRGTSQLQAFPAARDAFKRAAARWESVIQSQITVIIDVDFGTSLFGRPFENDTVGTTDTQVLGGNALYAAVRSSLVNEAYAPEKFSLYNALPSRNVPTDGGESLGMSAASANLRALSLIDPLADPPGESAAFGPPPAIGLNSKFSFDFDPSDGLAADKFDFEAIALHEIGHVLGFVSYVGQMEMDPHVEVEPSVWDLFRIRPDAVGTGFGTAPRVLSAGGEQSFYVGDSPLPLSTGRPNGTGGDGRAASHWKDDALTTQSLGIMDPTIGPGETHSITDNDVTVLEAIGYRTNILAKSLTLIPLISGQPQNGGMVAPPPNSGVVSHTQYVISVPPGATQLRIDLSGDQDVDLFARFGERVFIQGFRPESDYFSASDSGTETIIIAPSSSPALRSGIYYIAVANFGPLETAFTVTATVTGGTHTSIPAIFNVSTQLESDVLDIDYAAIDLDGNFAAAEVTILDEAGHPLGLPSTFALNTGAQTRIESHVPLGGMAAIPAARFAKLILVDRSGNRSAEVIIDFSKPQTGGLTIAGGSFDGARLVLNTRGVAENLEVEINGHVVAPPRAIKIKGSGKLTIKGNAGVLFLQPGANRIRVKNNSGWSNIFVLGL